MRSDRPFSETLVRLMEQEEITVRELVKRTKRRYGWGSPGTITFLRNGDLAPTMHAMEHIADALNGVNPEVFAEYRLMRERRMLDPEQVGLGAALEHLADIEAALRGAEPQRHPPSLRDDDEEKAEPA